ncbi:MAG: FtsX-like permease family protein [Candidatus Aminicenantes bacterium]|nr:FtsX-like permease family protein [Candidatus Aminicenantes bacterium]
MIVLKLASKNLLGAGLRTWLNVFVLSLAYVLIIFTQGLLEGMNKQAEEAMIASEVGGGQYWHPAYDPYDPLSLPDAHEPVPGGLRSLAEAGKAAPVLVIQGTIYPGGRLFTVLVKGIEPGQTVLNIPTSFLDAAGDDIPVLIGNRMAKATGLKAGDTVTLQWRDARGTFDARDATVVQVMTTSVQTIDAGQIWIPLARLRAMTGLEGEATFVILAQGAARPFEAGAWIFKSRDDFLADVRALVESKTAGSSILYAIFLALAMLGIFDTQVLSIFHRRKEMGTLMALGFTRGRLIRLFTLEGALNGVLAMLVASAYGIPLLTWMARTGWALPGDTDSYGFAIGERLFPSYGAGLVAGTTILVLLTTTVISFLPTRKIAKLKPTDALRGRMT